MATVGQRRGRLGQAQEKPPTRFREFTNALNAQDMS